MKKKYRILVLDEVAPRGVEVLRGISEFEVEESKPLKEDELIAKMGDMDAVVLRSQSKITKPVMQAAKKLKVVGRAGVGVDNVDVEFATEKGIVVMNTPGGNTISTAEHTFSLLLSLARNIPQANQSTKEGKWERKKFQGTEICNKTLGILGMGRIGSEVARRALAFGMRVLAYDPYLSVSRSKNLQVELFENLKEMLPQCDFVTMHMPMTKETRGMLNKETLALCKPTARIINCARGGLVEEAALEEAIRSKKLAGAALDVFEIEPPPEDFPLRKLDSVLMVPHLGASTYEAQESVGVEIAEAIRDMLLNGSIRNAVNMPNVDLKTLAVLRPYLDLGLKLGKALAQIAPSRCENLTITYYGKISELDTTAVTRAVLKGFLYQAGGGVVNEVNAPKFAANLGLKFSEVKQSETQDYSELISVEARTDGQVYKVKGTYFGAAQRIVNINGYPIDVCPEGVLLMMENKDQPGIVGRVGTLTGKENVNIGNMSLSRSASDSKALCVLNLDSMPSASLIEQVKKDNAIYSVQLVQF
ncbi:MAG: phosphoglycerate dehydrogenase [Verrucomicrobiota bacterium]